MPTRLWELGAGCLLFLIYRDWGQRWKKTIPNIETHLMILLVALLFLPIRFESFLTVIVVVLTALLIFFVRPASGAHRFLTSSIVIYIGLISYSLYLWHWSVLSVSRWTIGIHWWSAPFQVITILLFASASYRYVEIPFRRAEWLKAKWRPIGLGLSASFGSALIILFLLSVPNTFIINIVGIKIVGISSVPDLLPLKGSRLPYNPTCVVDGDKRLLKDDTFDLCTVLPSKKDGQMIWTLGDSHAGHLQGLLYSVYEKTGVGIHLIETPGVPFPMTQATKFQPREIIFNKIMNKLLPGDIVLVSRLFVSREKEISPLRDLSDWTAELLKLSDLLSLAGAKLVVVGPPPIFHFDVINQCTFLLSGASACDVYRASISQAIEYVLENMRRIAKQRDNIYIFDQFEILCPKSELWCSPMKGAIPLFRDKDHLNSYGSASLADDFIKFLHHSNILK
jgi:hypothetical protein